MALPLLPFGPCHLENFFFSLPFILFVTPLCNSQASNGLLDLRGLCVCVFLCHLLMMKPFYLCNSLATCHLLGSTVKQQDCTGHGKQTVLAWGGMLTRLIDQNVTATLDQFPVSERYSDKYIDHKSYTQKQAAFSLIPIPEEGNSGISHGPISAVQLRFLSLSFFILFWSGQLPVVLSAVFLLSNKPYNQPYIYDSSLALLYINIFN